MELRHQLEVLKPVYPVHKQLMQFLNLFHQVLTTEDAEVVLISRHFHANYLDFLWGIACLGAWNEEFVLFYEFFGAVHYYFVEVCH